MLSSVRWSITLAQWKLNKHSATWCVIKNSLANNRKYEKIAANRQRSIKNPWSVRKTNIKRITFRPSDIDWVTHLELCPFEIGCQSVCLIEFDGIANVCKSKVLADYLVNILPERWQHDRCRDSSHSITAIFGVAAESSFFSVFAVFFS